LARPAAAAAEPRRAERQPAVIFLSPAAAERPPSAAEAGGGPLAGRQRRRPACRPTGIRLRPSSRPAGGSSAGGHCSVALLIGQPRPAANSGVTGGPATPPGPRRPGCGHNPPPTNLRRPVQQQPQLRHPPNATHLSTSPSSRRRRAEVAVEMPPPVDWGGVSRARVPSPARARKPGAGSSRVTEQSTEGQCRLQRSTKVPPLRCAHRDAQTCNVPGVVSCAKWPARRYCSRQRQTVDWSVRDRQA
jgi:hypothetical protein